MPIIDTQRRARELGRIRLGQTVATSNGKTRPEKLDRFRFTSPSQALIERVAAQYGGTAREWTPPNGGAAQWEVVSDAKRIPVMVPPQPVTQWYELWSGGGCQRRCDGQTEILTESQCLCAQADERLCKPTTRLNVVLADIPGIGVWRVESHGWYAALELPQAAEFLAQTNGYIAAHLALEERSAKRVNERTGKPETRRWMVPTLEVDVTPRQLLAGEGALQVGASALNGNGHRQIEAPKPDGAADGSPSTDWHAQVADARDKDTLRALWRDAVDADALTDELRQTIEARVAELSGEGAGEGPEPAAPEDESNNASASSSGDTAERAALWQRILGADPMKTTTEAREAWLEFSGGEPFDTAPLEMCKAYAAQAGGAS